MAVCLGADGSNDIRPLFGNNITSTTESTTAVPESPSPSPSDLLPAANRRKSSLSIIVDRLTDWLTTHSSKEGRIIIEPAEHAFAWLSQPIPVVRNSGRQHLHPPANLPPAEANRRKPESAEHNNMVRLLVVTIRIADTKKLTLLSSFAKKTQMTWIKKKHHLEGTYSFFFAEPRHRSRAKSRRRRSWHEWKTHEAESVVSEEGKVTLLRRGLGRAQSKDSCNNQSRRRGTDHHWVCSSFCRWLTRRDAAAELHLRRRDLSFL
jgi:hypothetical protein